MRVMECTRCGAQQGDESRKDWGKTKETVGYGRNHVCVELVPNGLYASNGEAALEVCGGTLLIAEKESNVVRIKKHTPLGE